ncbi:MAG: sensor histidine kinase [Bacteroidota bacterium]
MTEGGDLTLILILVIGTLAMLVLAMGLFFFFVIYQKRMIAKELEVNQIRSLQQKELLRTTILAEENERKRFAEDLHDEIGAMLSAIKMNLNRLEKKSEDNLLRSLAADTKHNLDEVIFNIRRITRALLPPSLERFGLGQAIGELVGWVDRSSSGRIRFTEYGDIRRIDIRREMTVFRIIQELLNNALKYSQAGQIDIRLRYGRTNICVWVKDNGVGFDPAEARGKGLGLQNLKGRAEVINAVFRIRSSPGKGSSAILITTVDQDERYT